MSLSSWDVRVCDGLERRAPRGEAASSVQRNDAMHVLLGAMSKDAESIAWSTEVGGWGVTPYVVHVLSSTDQKDPR